MLLNKRNKQVAIIVAAMVMAMLTLVVQRYELGTFLEIVRVLMVVATAFGLFGILKKDPEHKDKFLFIWLCLTSVLFFGYCLTCMHNFTYMFYYDLWGHLLTAICSGAGAGFLGYLMNCIFQDFQELRKGNFGTYLDVTTPSISQYKEPPAYTPTTDNLSVIVQS